MKSYALPAAILALALTIVYHATTRPGRYVTHAQWAVLDTATGTVCHAQGCREFRREFLKFDKRPSENSSAAPAAGKAWREASPLAQGDQAQVVQNLERPPWEDYAGDGVKLTPVEGNPFDQFDKPSSAFGGRRLLPPTFHGYRCTDDCSGHEAGYEWAEDNEIDDEGDCSGNSRSFIEGCIAYVEENE